jgi:hypothetical protein
MELLNQLDGFDYLVKTKIIIAANRPDTWTPLYCMPEVWTERSRMHYRMGLEE